MIIEKARAESLIGDLDPVEERGAEKYHTAPVGKDEQEEL
jgi:hypothetical protein